MTMHPLTANEAARQRSEEKVARGLAAYAARGEERGEQRPLPKPRLRERPWRALTLSLGDALLDALDRRRAPS